MSYKIWAQDKLQPISVEQYCNNLTLNCIGHHQSDLELLTNTSNPSCLETIAHVKQYCFFCFVLFLPFRTNVHLYLWPCHFCLSIERELAETKTRICVLSIPRKFWNNVIGKFCQKQLQLHYFDIQKEVYDLNTKKKLNCILYISVFNQPRQRVCKILTKHFATLVSATSINYLSLRGHLIICGFL